MGVLCYADNFTLIRQTLTELKYMLSIRKNYVDAYKILFNASKNQLLHVKKNTRKNTLEMNNKKKLNQQINAYILEFPCLYIE